MTDNELTRRRLLEVGSASATAIGAAQYFPFVGSSVAATATATPTARNQSVAQIQSPSDGLTITLLVNGTPYPLTIDPRTSLLDALRDHIGLTGTKKGCDHGQCGACTVHVAGRRVLSCLILSASIGPEDIITTIEGISGTDGTLHPMQQAFIDHDAFQCGYCTPGQILSAIGCVWEGHADDDAATRQSMSGNLCRCAAYPNIVLAIKSAKPLMKGVQDAPVLL